MIMNRMVGYLFPERVFLNIIKKFGPQKMAERTLQKLESEGIVQEVAGRIAEKFAAESGFHRCTTKATRVRASRTAAAAPWVMLPPASAFEGREIVYKFYSPSTGEILSFYKTNQ